MHIVIEGFDGCGKNTQTRHLQARLEHLGHEVGMFSFPRYKTLLGEAIRKHLVKEITLTCDEDAMIFQCMMATDKYDAAPEIATALKRGAFVICDRWWPSAYCYGAADGLSPEWLLRTHEWLPQADLNIFLDITPEEALRRRPNLRDRYEMDRKKQAVVRDYYRSLWTACSFQQGHVSRGVADVWRVVDGEASEEDVHERIWQLVVSVSRDFPTTVGGKQI
jgi:dTMP kinase